MVLLTQSFEHGTNGTTLTGGSGGNTAGTGDSFLDSVTIGTGGTLAFSSAFAAHGLLSAKAATGATAAGTYMTWSTSLGSVTTLYGRIYLNLSAAPAATDAIIQFRDGAGGWAGGIQLTTGLQLAVQDTVFTTLNTLTTVLATGTWYRVEWKLAASGASAGQVTVSLYAGDNTVPAETWTSPGTATIGGTATGSVLFGWTGAHASQPAAYLDDLGLSTAGYLGPAAGAPGAAVDGAGYLNAGGIAPVPGAAAVAGAGYLAATSMVLAPVVTFPGALPNPLGAKIELNLNGTWTDITAYVMLRDGISISNMGRPDESGTITASQLTFTLKDPSGNFTPKNSSSPFYPYIVRNCPVRISVDALSSTGVRYKGYRFHGEVSAWPVGYDVSQRDVYVQVTASGIWRRIAQSQVSIGSAYARYVKLLTGGSLPAAYWAMEDGSGSAGFVLSEGTGTNLIPAGTPSYAADGSSFAGSNAIPQLNGARIAANVSMSTPSSLAVRFALSVPAAGDSTASTFATSDLFRIITAGSVAQVVISLAANKLTIAGVNAGGGQVFSGTVNTKVNGTPVLVSFEQTSGAWALKIIKPGATSVLDQVTGGGSFTVGKVTQVQISDAGRFNDTGFGQLGVWGTAGLSLVTAAGAIGGWAGEYAVSRFQRLCSESNIPYAVIGSASAQMGPQADDTMANVLQSIEDSDGGMLYETRDAFGLGYRTLASMQDQSPAVTLNYSAGVLGAPLQPAYDDALLVNSWTVTNSDGYAAAAQLTSGALSTQPPPNGVGGGYSKSKTVTCYSHAQVNALARQLLFEGTVDDLRYPVVSVNMARSAVAGQFAAIPGLRPGDYFQVTSLPSFLGGSTAKQLAWGYSEKMVQSESTNTWAIDFNAIPEAPFESSFSPGVYSVGQATSGSVAQGSSVVSGAQLGSGAVGGNALSSTISARSLGGITQYISATTPYDWTFAVSGSPSDTSSFICTQDQALPIAAGDTFTSSLGLGGPFTITSVDPPGGGNVTVHFTPVATQVMSGGTVSGGKNGDQWINTAGDNQLAIWSNGSWQVLQFGPTALSFTAGGAKVTIAASAPGSPATGDLWYDSTNGYELNQWTGSAWAPYQFGTNAITAGAVTTNLLAANAVTAAKIAAGTITASQIASGTITAAQIAAGTITASQIASGIVIAGIVDATTVQAQKYIATGTQGEFLAYTGSPASGNLAVSVSGFAGTDSFSNSFAAGVEVKQGGLILDNQSSAPSAVSGASQFYSSVAGRPRYLSSAGSDAVLERSEVNVSQFTIGNTTTATALSPTLTYQAGEGSQSSEFEIEIMGVLTGAATASVTTFDFRLYLDGSNAGGGFTIGATVFSSTSTNNQPFVYTVRYLVSILTTGTGGTIHIHGDGSIAATANKVTTDGADLGGDIDGVAFDTTSSHTLRIMGFWGGTATGQTGTTYRSKIARRM